MKKFYLILICILLFSFMLSGQTKFTISTTDLPPGTSPSLEGNGLLPQFVTEAFKGKNYTVEYQFVPFARLVALMQDNKFEASIFNKLQANDEKYYLKEILNCTGVFFYKKSKFPNGLTYKELSDLKQYRVGVVRGAPTIKMFEDAGITVDLAVDEQGDFKKLQADKIDLVSTVDLWGWYAIKQIGARLDDYASTKPQAIFQTTLFISKALPNSKKIIDDFNTGFEAAKKSGKLTKILETVYGKGRVPDYCLP